MRIRTLTFVALMLALGTSASAQTTKFSLRGGAAVIVEDTHPGLAAAFDFKPGNAPLAFSLSVEIFPRFEDLVYGEDYGPDLPPPMPSELNRAYYGLDVLLTKPLDESGVFGGVGMSFTHWAIPPDRTGRGAFVYDALVGYRKMTSQRIGFSGQVKFYMNPKTDSDTERFNDPHGGPTSFLFDNDIVARVGIVWVL